MADLVQRMDGINVNVEALDAIDVGMERLNAASRKIGAAAAGIGRWLFESLTPVDRSIAASEQFALLPADKRSIRA